MHMHELTCTCLEFDEERAGIAGPLLEDDEVGEALDLGGCHSAAHCALPSRDGGAAAAGLPG